MEQATGKFGHEIFYYSSLILMFCRFVNFINFYYVMILKIASCGDLTKKSTEHQFKLQCFVFPKV